MTDQHPITPPPELVQQWEADATISREAASSWTAAFATRAAQWGADTELEACCEWLKKNTNYHMTIEYLRAARRPKPPSLKEQALAALGRYMTGETILTKDSLDTIRRALEALPE
jgi:hypothetical protein